MIDEKKLDSYCEKLTELMKRCNRASKNDVKNRDLKIADNILFLVWDQALSMELDKLDKNDMHNLLLLAEEKKRCYSMREKGFLSVESVET